MSDNVIEFKKARPPERNRFGLAVSPVDGAEPGTARMVLTPKGPLAHELQLEAIEATLRPREGIALLTSLLQILQPVLRANGFGVVRIVEVRDGE
ncbi:MAG: hypothetical protein ACK4N5_07920 [Myxococcales bacterium]